MNTRNIYIARDSRLASRDLYRILAFLAVLAASTMAAAETLQGTVTNGTNGKPGAGDEVTLLSLGQGMTEAGETKADASGHFQFTYSDTGMPHLVRVTHQGVGYFRMAPPGTTSVEVQTYDVAKSVDGISTTAEVVRFQSSGNSLQAIELIAVQNASQPPRTLAGERSYEIALPEGAVIDEAGARSPGGQPITTMPEAVAGRQYHYAYSFPLRPGETQFEISYHLPYSGARTVVSTTLLHPLQHFVAVLPATMQFTASGAGFAPMAGQNDANVQVASNTRAGDRLAMTISGTGVLADEGAPESDQPAASSSNNMGQGPGGGLGKPINSPDPLSNYRWPLLGGLAAVLVGGGFYVANNRSSVPTKVPTARATTVTEAPVQAAPSTALLNALKEELFQLEIERQQGQVSEAAYQQAKAGLDLALRRVVNRQG